MQSPFAIFRKNAKMMTIILTGLAMFAFVVLSSIESMPALFPPVMGFVVGGLLFWALSGKSGAEGGGIAIVGGIVGVVMMVYVAPKFFPPKSEVRLKNGVSLTTTDINKLSEQRRIANQFSQYAYHAATGSYMKQAKFNFISAPERQRQDVIFGYLLNLKADEMGITISDAVVQRFINNELTNKKLSKTQFIQILRKLRVSEKQLFDNLRHELRARMVQQTLQPNLFQRQLVSNPNYREGGNEPRYISPNLANPVTPQQLWDFYNKTDVTESLSVIPVATELFVDNQAKPEEGKLKEFFEKYKSRRPNTTLKNEPAPGEPGFLQPRRIQVGYFVTDQEKAEEKIRKNLETEVIPDKEVADLKKDFQAQLESLGIAIKSAEENVATYKDKKEADPIGLTKVEDELKNLTTERTTIQAKLKALSSSKPIKRLDYLVVEYYEKNKETEFKNVTPPPLPKPNTPVEKPSGPELKPPTTEKPSDKNEEKGADKKEENKNNTTKKTKTEPAKNPEEKKTSLKQPVGNIKFVSYLADEKENLKTDQKKEVTKPVAPATPPKAAEKKPIPKKGATNKSETTEKEPLPEYVPLDDDLRRSIEDKIITARAIEFSKNEIKDAMKFMDEVRLKYYSKVNQSKLNNTNGNQQQVSQDDKNKKESSSKFTTKQRIKIMQDYAKLHQLKYFELEPLSFSEMNKKAVESTETLTDATKVSLEKYEFGLSKEVPPMPGVPPNMMDSYFIEKIYARQHPTIPTTLFRRQMWLKFTTHKSTNYDNDKKFAYWLIDDIKEHTPQFKDPGIEEKVLTAWRTMQAMPLAEKRAEELSKQVRSGELFQPLVAFTVAELRVALVAQGMDKERLDEDMLGWLQDEIKAQQEAISDIGIEDKEDKKPTDKKEEEVEKEEGEKSKKPAVEPKETTPPPQAAPKKKEQAPAKKENKKTSEIGSDNGLKFVLFQDDKKSKDKKPVKAAEKSEEKAAPKEEPKKKVAPQKADKPTSPQDEKRPVKKTPAKRDKKKDEELLKLEFLSKALIYTTGEETNQFELQDPTKVQAILDWLTSRIETPQGETPQGETSKGETSKGDLAKKEQLEKVKVSLSVLGKKDSPLLTFENEESFSWYQMNPRTGQLSFGIGQDSVIKKPDNNFFEYVFETLKNGETGFVSNFDKSITYVVTVHGRTPENEVQRLFRNERFVQEASQFPSGQQRFSPFILSQQNGINSAWATKFMQEYGWDLNAQNLAQ